MRGGRIVQHDRRSSIGIEYDEILATDLSEGYGEKYYSGYYERSPRWFNFFNHVADCLVEQFAPRKTLDAGCAWGLLVEVLRQRGVESFGIDFSAYAISQVHPDVQPFCRCGSLAEPIPGGPYDVVTCIEVLEHLDEADALRAIANLTAVTDVIVFSSTPDATLVDPTHINVHPVIYWLRAFAEHGFYPPAESDALFLADHAFIVRRSPLPLPDEALEMFVQLMELRAESRRKAVRLDAMAPVQFRAAELEAQFQEASETLEEIQSSVGWQFICQYRSWRSKVRAQSPSFFRTWEGTARVALHRLETAAAKRANAVPLVWDYAAWIAKNEPSNDDLKAQVALANALDYRPKFSVVMPVYKISTEILGAAIDSLKAQTYDNWELCASVIESLNPECAALLRERAQGDSRILVRPLESNLGISGNSNAALEMASGEFIALLDHDDTLAPFALYETALLLNEDPSANFIYSDRDEVSEDGARRFSPFFKPGWSPEIMMTANYLTHLCVIRAANVRDIGGWRSETDGAQDWDLFLRVTHKHGGVRHIPKILYHWRQAPTSVATGGLDSKPYARAAQVRTVESYCRNANLRQTAAFIAGNPKIIWRLCDLPSVSIIVLRGAVGADETAEKAKSISMRPECETAEVICQAIEGQAGPKDGVKFVALKAGSDVVDQANQLISASAGEVLVFIDGSIDLDASNWLREMVGPLLLPGVGLCGCHFSDYRNGLVRNIGLAFDAEGNASRVRPRYPQAHFLLGWDEWLRNWSAASGACFAIQRKTWDEVGGFAAPNSHSRPDIRLCLKLAERGLRVVTNPAARVRQSATAALELRLQIQDEEDQRIVRSVFPHGDTHINPNMHLKDGLLTPR